MKVLLFRTCLLLLIGPLGLMTLLIPKANGDDRIKVFAVNYPLAYFAERIGGDAVRVDFPVPSDVDPAYWKPSDREIVAAQSADLVLLNGANYAKWVQIYSLPRRTRVITSAAATARYIPIPEEVDHSHGPEGAHEHGEFAFTTWLDFELAKLQAKSTFEALSRLRPDRTGTFRQAFAGLEADLKMLDDKMTALSKLAIGQTIMASHPVYQYLAAAYNIDIVSLHWEPDEMPDHAAWLDFEQLRRDNKDTLLMIWEDKPLPSVVERLRKTGVRISIFRPGGNKPKSGDFVSLMTANIDSFSELLAGARE